MDNIENQIDYQDIMTRCPDSRADGIVNQIGSVNIQENYLDTQAE